MTDVAEAIVNGEGESSSAGDQEQSADIKDGGRGGNEDEASLAESVTDNIDNDDEDKNVTEDDFHGMETCDSTTNQALEGSEQPDEMDEEEKDEEEEPSSQINDNDFNHTSGDADDGDGEGKLTIAEDEPKGKPRRAEVVTEYATMVKLEPSDEETQMDEEEQDSNSVDTVPMLIGKTLRGANSTEHEEPGSPSVRNGSATLNDNDSSDKSLLTGLLQKKEAGSSPKSTSSQGSSYSLNDGNAIAKGLEDHVEKLDNLLILKEKEWSAILRLKKHLEYALDQVKCTQRMGKIQEGMNGPMSATDVKACMNLIAGHKDLFDSAERRIEESIESAEGESEYLQTVFPCNSESSQLKDDSSPVSKVQNFTATAALQQLCERKRKAMDELSPAKGSRVRVIDVRPQNQQSKVIGNGRKGAIVDVQSIIDSHRNSNSQSFPQQRKSKKTAYTDLINLGPDRQYVKTIEDLAILVDASRPMSDSTPIPCPVPTSTVSQISKPTIIVKSKNNGRPTARQPVGGGGNSLLISPMPSSSGTLAKMLSPSTHSNIGSNRSSIDVSNTSQKFANKHSNADANLSLANLLATSKVETKVNMPKIKKERLVRDEEPSHVPSQQEAVPICQGCNLSRAQFVCAGCANQWYCSRECQVAAWDEHSEICSG